MKKYIVSLAAAILIQSSLAHADKKATYEPQRTERSLGKITIARTDVNPDGQTKLALELCSHPGIGKIKICDGFLYETGENGWLNKEKINFGNHYNPVVVISAGRYYLKMKSEKTGKDYYASGDISITPFVTNFVHVEVE